MKKRPSVQPNKLCFVSLQWLLMFQHQIEEIQAGRDNDKFVECRHISGHTYYYSGNAIKEVSYFGAINCAYNNHDNYNKVQCWKRWHSMSVSGSQMSLKYFEIFMHFLAVKIIKQVLPKNGLNPCHYHEISTRRYYRDFSSFGLCSLFQSIIDCYPI